MHPGFSYVGVIFLLMLFVPNALWVKRRPEGYDEAAKNEKKLFVIPERIGEVAVTATLPCFRDFNVRAEAWALWLAAAFALMLLYEGFWVRYFRSARTMRDFYAPFLGVPLAGATLPVAAVLLIAVYGGSPLLLAAGLVLGFGHIGVHMQHRRETEKEQKK